MFVLRNSFTGGSQLPLDHDVPPGRPVQSSLFMLCPFFLFCQSGTVCHDWCMWLLCGDVLVRTSLVDPSAPGDLWGHLPWRVASRWDCPLRLPPAESSSASPASVDGENCSVVKTKSILLTIFCCSSKTVIRQSNFILIYESHDQKW